MGKTIFDPDGSDTGVAGSIEDGLGLIPADTVFQKKKTIIRTKGMAAGIPLSGYEIHFGQTIVDGMPFLTDGDHRDGYRSHDGRICGTYLHHLFYNDVFRADWLNRIRREKGLDVRPPVVLNRDSTYDAIAAHLEKHLDWPVFEAILEGRR
jgi:adenosylcobyric acid synthase